MPETIEFWIRWFWESFRTMPAFLGNNWVGAIFACACVFFYERQSLLSSSAFAGALTKRAKAIVVWSFLMNHWRGTLKLWTFVLAGFFVGHTFETMMQPYLLIINKNVTPVRITGICDVHLDSISADPVGSGTYSGGASFDYSENPPIRYGQFQQPNSFTISFVIPAWTPESPIRVKVKYHSLKTARCTFQVR